MKTKIMLLAIFCTINTIAQAMPISNSEQTYYLKVRNNTRNSVDEHAVTMIYLNGSSASSDCRNENDYNACQKFNNAVSKLISICYKYKYQPACDSAEELQRHHTVMTILQ